MTAAAASETILAQLKESAQLYVEFPSAQVALVVKAGEMMTNAVREGHKLIWFGNGGSATQSQHMAGEFVGRFRKDRRPLASISLTENMASITAIGNDYSYENIFARQLEGLAQPGDVAIGLSTSGNSPNVVKALQKAKALGLPTIGLTGGTGGKMAGLCDIVFVVPSTTTARIQELHLTIGHILCGLVEDGLGLSSHSCSS